MLGTLLAKDLRRALRNPVPYLVQLCVPLVITALLGLVFGGHSEDGGLGRIRFAVVDEDNSPLTGFLRGALNQDQAATRLEPVFLARAEALRQVTNNALSAALIIPAHFARDYLLRTNAVALELVKNPAQAFHPAILEELLRVVTTGLSAVKQNFSASLGDWRDVLSGDQRPTMREVSGLLDQTADRLDALRDRLDPVPVWFDKKQQAATSAAGKSGLGAAGNAMADIFAFLLPGLAAMFLLFLADVAMRDLRCEAQQRTFSRFCTLPPGPAIFVASKVVFTFLMVFVGAAILLGGGGAIFGIRWASPLILAVLAAALAVFAGGLLACSAALVAGARGAEVINTIGVMLLGLASGCAFPSNALPDFLRYHVTPLLPPAWFIEGVRGTQSGGAGSAPWPLAAVKLAALGVLLTLLAAWLFRRRLRRNAMA
ncbi:MAG TPA: ABC transporter permease [Verrucomicrobiota bacterium]|nr:ABC transporter permease [Verrucomicrobiota bacterium]HNU50347.1 ABC transporter permease [Verrucomicrobiota bacterium]